MKLKSVYRFSLIAVVTLFLVSLLVLGVYHLSVYYGEQQVLKKENLSAPQAGLGHAIGYVVPIEKGLPVYLFPEERLAHYGVVSEEPQNYPNLEPVATTDENGKWIALNVKPGRYCVLLFDPNNVTLVFHNDDFIEVKEGTVTRFPTREPPKR